VRGDGEELVLQPREVLDLAPRLDLLGVELRVLDGQRRALGEHLGQRQLLVVMARSGSFAAMTSAPSISRRVRSGRISSDASFIGGACYDVPAIGGRGRHAADVRGQRRIAGGHDLADDPFADDVSGWR
jgi:hypothetical protein